MIYPNPKPAIYLRSLDNEEIRHEDAAFLLLEQDWLLVFIYHLYAKFTPPLTLRCIHKSTYLSFASFLPSLTPLLSREKLEFFLLLRGD